MDFLIGNILERIEKCSKEGNSNPLEKDVRNLVLEHKKVEEGNNNKMDWKYFRNPSEKW